MEQAFEEAVSYLYRIPKFTEKHSLKHTRELLKRLDDPALDRRIIHVAGSNGKGSVCNNIYYMLQAGGYTVGLFTSPHLVDLRERFQINGAMVSKPEFLEAFGRVKTVARNMEAEGLGHPTFFEFLFAVGMLLFKAAHVEYIILETGLGGRLDCTNCVPDPVMTILTSISLEHTEYLGDTLEQIAAEKAGILKPGVPVICDGTCPKALPVIRSRARELRCPLTVIGKDHYVPGENQGNHIDFFPVSDYDNIKKWRIPFGAEYQVVNALLSMEAIRQLGLLKGTVMAPALARASWPGRMQEVLPDVYFDGAHNPDGIRVFMEAVKTMIRKDVYPPLLLFSMVKDKDYRRCCELLTETDLWQEIAVTRIPDERGIAPKVLLQILILESELTAEGYEDYREAFSRMREKQKPGQKLFCTGSLYFIGALLALTEEERHGND